jgi:hypothetical protein
MGNDQLSTARQAGPAEGVQRPEPVVRQDAPRVDRVEEQVSEPFVVQHGDDPPEIE